MRERMTICKFKKSNNLTEEERQSIAEDRMAWLEMLRDDHEFAQWQHEWALRRKQTAEQFRKCKARAWIVFKETYARMKNSKK